MTGVNTVVSAQMRAVVQAARIAGGPADLQDHRARAELFVQAHPADPGVVIEPAGIDGLDAVLLRQQLVADTDRTVLYLHSGGYVAGSPAFSYQVAGRLSRAAGTRFLLPAYRLAPEHPFPAALDDVLTAYRWLLDSGVAAERIALGGVSAGGGLAIAAMVAIRDLGLAPPAAAFVLSPWTDLTLTSSTMTAQDSADPVSSRSYLAMLAGHYAGAADPRDPLISPRFAELHGLPPLHVEVGAPERLLDDSRRLAEQAIVGGTTVTLAVVDGALHGFPHSAPDTPEARDALARIAGHLRTHLTP